MKRIEIFVKVFFPKRAILYTVKIKKVKFTLEQATKAQKGRRDIALLVP